MPYVGKSMDRKRLAEEVAQLRAELRAAHAALARLSARVLVAGRAAEALERLGAAQEDDR